MPTTDENSFRSSKSMFLLMKILYVVIVFIFGFGLLLKIIGYSGDSITLRKFPYPFRAALAICNDINGTDSLKEFLAIQYYLCSRESTPWGEGLGLEIGNSIWFYDFSGGSTFTILDTSGSINSVESSVITQFIQSGYIDALNTFGNLPDREFDIALAESAMVYLQRDSLTLPVWMLNKNDKERKFPHDWIVADSLYSDSGFCTKDLIHQTGIRYIADDHPTHVVGQQSSMSMLDWLKMNYEFFRSILLSTKQTEFTAKRNNDLISIMEVADSCTYIQFTRFIDHDGKIPRTGVDAGYLAHQLRKENVENLIEHDGYMILFTQLGENQLYSELIPLNSRQALENVADRFAAGELMVTTTSRLLNYNVVHKYLNWKWDKKADYYDVMIEGIDSPVTLIDDEAFELYQGLTFYTPDPENTRIFLNNEIVSPVEINPPDDSGIGSVSIPWKWLEFPKAIDFSN